LMICSLLDAPSFFLLSKRRHGGVGEASCVLLWPEWSLVSIVRMGGVSRWSVVLTRFVIDENNAAAEFVRMHSPCWRYLLLEA
jgi:hypothetical protein